MTNRRDFLKTATTLAGALVVGNGRAAATDTPPPAADAPPQHDMSAMPASWMGNDKIAMLLYPGFTALDLVGPQYFFASLMGANVQLVAKDRAPVMSDTGLAIMPTATLDECPADLDVLFVPGSGGGVLDAMEDPALVAFAADRGTRRLIDRLPRYRALGGARGIGGLRRDPGRRTRGARPQPRDRRRRIRRTRSGFDNGRRVARPQLRRKRAAARRIRTAAAV
jgi:cyclohexyl-isocyanide hydratase